LRKREAAGVDGHNVPLRAQRNLALNFGPNTSIGGVTNSLSGSSSGGPSIGSGITPISSSSASASAAVAANKENNSNTGSLGLGPIGGSGGGQSNVQSCQSGTSTNYSSSTGGNLSILKKEFQPPNEESSWQSCSSNSSSGSTTLSTTSETAEIQLQQLQQLHQPVPVPELNLTLGGSSLASLPGSSSSSNQPLTNFSSVPMGHSSAISRLIPDTNLNGPSSLSTTAMTNQNGIGGGGSRPNISSGGPRVRTASSSKGLNKDIERLKGKSKDDYVSPRKKPRKQQLTTSDLLESASPEISFYQGKKFKKSELMDPKMFEGFSEKSKELPDASPSEHIVYYIKKPHVSLLNDSYAARPITNHFFKYSDVKAKEERRPTINDLANQKNVSQKVTGWKLTHLMHQIDQVVGLEMNVVSNFNHLLNMMDAKVGPNCASRDLNRIQELLKGNIQRCKVIRDQMSESRSQVGKIVEHRSRVQDVINKFASKRPSKKRERP
jgi:histone deacetylase complex subunit SAP130